MQKSSAVRPGRSTAGLGAELLLAAVDRHLYFVHALPEDRDYITLPELHQLIADYIERDSAELVELAAERDGRKKWRSGEGKTKREVEIEKQMETDRNEYKSGFSASLARASELAGKGKLIKVPLRL